MNELLNLIKSKKAKVGVVGLGYVGLPLAVEASKAGFTVMGFDVQNEKVNNVNAGKNYIGDIVGSELAIVVKDGKLSATTDYAKIKDCDVIIICVPTPLDKYMQPDITYIVNSTNEIAKNRKKKTLIVLESTTYPGTTEEVLKPILEKDGSKVGVDFFLAFSPERVDPGNEKFKTQNTPKVVGGCTKNCNELAKEFYGLVLSGGVHTVSSPSVAEMEKLLENIFRLVNIGLVNELALLCDKMKVDIWEVVDAAKTKPYGFMPFYPGPGLGGHCIPIDPFYLTWKAKEYNFHTRIIDVAGQINQSMPNYVVNKVGKILNEHSKCYANSNIVLLGVAYKRDIDDYRESPVIQIYESLVGLGAKVSVIDPHVPEFRSDHTGNKYKTVQFSNDLLRNADIVVLTTDHKTFDRTAIMENSKLIFDTRNFMGQKSSKIYSL